MKQYLITEQQKIDITNCIANAVHPGVPYLQVQNFLMSIDKLQEHKDDSNSSRPLPEDSGNAQQE